MSRLAQLAIEQLVEWGIVDFCICPGSRSTPLTLAVARHPKATSYIFHDERSATFCALGFGKVGKLSVLITTSGTAVANAMPAVVEANMAGIPLLLMTADRPPDLRFTNANQTIDQVKIFGDQVRFFFDVPCESDDYLNSSLQNILGFAVSKCIGFNPGPVHLNWMFREPFDLQPVHVAFEPHRLPQGGLIHLNPTQIKEIKDIVKRSNSGILIVGELTDPLEIDALKELLKHCSWPIFVDASSGLSLMNIPNRVLCFEDILRAPPVELNPDAIVQFGNGLCTKRYELWLQTVRCPILVFNARPISSNPAGVSIHRYQVHLQTLHWLQNYMTESTLLSWTTNHNRSIRQTINRTMGWSELQVLDRTLSLIPKNGQLFIGNSMPIRDLNSYVDRAVNIPVYSNRGASGIDGLPSTALGVHLATQKPTLLVLGDLSLMHDFGVLFTLKSMVLNAPFIIVVINNFGGGIFGALPISKEQDVFESHFATVHTHMLTRAVQGMGIDGHLVDNTVALDRAIERCWQESGRHIIEAMVDREVSGALRSTIRQQTDIQKEPK